MWKWQKKRLIWGNIQKNVLSGAFVPYTGFGHGSEPAGADQRSRRNRPERTFGSNQVDFGGMTSPASATAMSC